MWPRPRCRTELTCQSNGSVKIIWQSERLSHKEPVTAAKCRRLLWNTAVKIDYAKALVGWWL